jgi:glycosyltransferase involved in cell wall biosynthesis
MRIELLKKGLIAGGHDCAVLNIGANRLVPSPEYDTVEGLWDFVRKVWRYAQQGYVAHTHANGEATKGLALAILAEVLTWVAGARSILTFHAGVDQPCFPRQNAPLMAPVYWLLFAIPDRIVCNSGGVRQKILEYGVRADKVRAIPAFTQQYLEFAEAPLPPDVAAFFEHHPRVIFTYVRMQAGYYLDVLIDGFGTIARRHSDAGLLILGVDETADTARWAETQAHIARLGVGPRIHTLTDVDHDAFLTLLTRSTLYLRTPSSDGIASSVLEALALGVPVVASENGTRPAGVITYPATDPHAMAERVCETLDRRDDIARTMPRPEIQDTLADEIAWLTAK